MELAKVELFILSLALSSCDFHGESNYTPGVFFVHQPVKNHHDTLSVYYTEEVGRLCMDTITVGDTISFFMHFEAYSNNLTAINLRYYPDSVAELILPEKATMDSIFSPTSDYAKGNFFMDSSFSTLGFPFRLIALQPSADARLELTVVSDAVFEDGFGTNFTCFKLKTPIKTVQIIEQANE
jgi:hypothetical protein